MGYLLRIAALVLFIVAPLGLWVANLTLTNAVGIVSCGLAAWVASTIVPAGAP